MNKEKAASRLTAYTAHLCREERSENTIRKYLHDISACLSFLADQEMTKEAVLCWKEQLMQHHATASVNSMLSAVNDF